MRCIESATLREFRNGTDAQQLVVLTGMSVGAGFGGITASSGNSLSCLTVYLPRSKS